MPIFKSKPRLNIINGKEVESSEYTVVTNNKYTTNGENFIIIKEVSYCEISLNSNTCDHVIIKSLTNVLVKSNELIDEEFNEVELNKGACVEFKKIGDYWYILSSDGLKNS
jgi:hypothetical protein